MWFYFSPPIFRQWIFGILGLCSHFLGCSLSKLLCFSPSLTEFVLTFGRHKFLIEPFRSARLYFGTKAPFHMDEFDSSFWLEYIGNPQSDCFCTPTHTDLHRSARALVYLLISHLSWPEMQKRLPSFLSDFSSVSIPSCAPSASPLPSHCALCFPC